MKFHLALWLLLVAGASCAQSVEFYAGAARKGAGGGVSFRVQRLAFHGEQWQHGTVPKARIATAALRAWRGLHVEGGGGMRRTVETIRWTELVAVPILDPWCPRKCAPLGIGDRVETHQYDLVEWRRFAAAGAYYQTPKRVFARVGYRRLFVAGGRDEDQVYAVLGWTF